MGRQILIVDDSDTSLQVLRRHLQDEPFDVLTAKDGAAGVRLARERRPDLILMDLIMPRLDGLNAVRELKRTLDTRDIPVIMVTTRDDPEQVERSYSVGCSDYVTKPVDRGELLSKISWHLER
jgi:CheY-like chemotaxis protein